MATRKWLPETIVQVSDRVEARLDEPWSLARMAAAACFSTFHFHRLFSEATGETPAAFVERLRLERAALLLLASDRSITELALAVGYRRPETFARRFKQRFEVSARGYRRRQIELWTELGLAAGKDPLGAAGEIRVVALPETAVEVRRGVGEDAGFDFADPEPWAGLEPAVAPRVGLGLDWPGITAATRTRQDWGRRLDGRPVAAGWTRRLLGGGLYAGLTTAGLGPVPPTVYQRLFVWSAAGRYRLRPGPILEIPDTNQVTVHQPVTDTLEA